VLQEVQAVKEKKPQISEKSARFYFIMTFCTAILLFLYMDVSGRTGEVPEPTGPRARAQKGWNLLKKPPARRNARPRTNIRALPVYPWDETNDDLQIDLQAARDALSGRMPSERAVGARARRLLDSRLVLPPGRVFLWQLRKHVEEQADVQVKADVDAWNRHPWITSSGKEVKLRQALLQLENRSGVKHVVMKDHTGEAVLFLIGPQTSD
jgi:hypothetical protein